MAEEIKPVASEVPPAIVETPEPAPVVKTEEKLYPDTPNGAVKTPDVKTEEITIVETPAATTETKTPTELVKDPAKPAGEAVPVDYDLKLPENSPLTKEDVIAVSKEAKDSGLTKEQAEARLKTENDIAVRTATRIQQKNDDSLKVAQTQWLEEVKNDPELGGDKFNETSVLASRAYKQLASPAMQKIVKDAGLGNHPEFVRMMAKAGRMMAEDTMHIGRSGAVAREKPREEKMYGATTPGANGKLPGA